MPTNQKRRLGTWLGVLPFAIFAVAFIFWPAANLFVGAFQTPSGDFTLDNIFGLAQPFILEALSLTIWISLVTAVGGGIFGFLLAYAAILGGVPRWVRDSLATFSGVASNFAGVPLAFAFTVTLGRVGFVTVLLRTLFGINLYRAGFNLYTFGGLCLVYMYFQFPLTVLMIGPALDGLKREWREAAGNLGASQAQYWRLV